MKFKMICCVPLLLASSVAVSAEPPETAEPAETRNLGMSVVGNNEAPKALVIVPWKSSELGTRPDVSGLLDDITRPVDKDVFMRELEYFRIRAE
jgi:hypothetical protein